METGKILQVECRHLHSRRSIVAGHGVVVIEGRYNDWGNFDYLGAGNDDNIRLVSLASWSFACIDREQSFTQILKKLNRNPSYPRLPQNANYQAEQKLAMGYIPLPHSLRQGSQTISWYRSPLIPDRNIRNNADFSRNTDRQITGIILRSQVVPGWPSLIIDGYSQSVSGLDFTPPDNLLPILRIEKLAKDVLICLFEGEVKTVDIYLKG
ncbi:hypothetical protein IQ235_16095 [Oscillatoriales cyanobacterium LEGE 11467]|uniref:Uncharacterized protein n=1 Tax=Zarconia navalis LEGE 11467 TaxID=1828826 RepID=A0A928W326_9CYAN|nr:hypothetical protein [Zarconia navalis]MBE9042300.1 hypothetical protein [Zarconia navalis LEGE 11467]